MLILIILAGMLGIAILAGTSFFALSKKSSFLLRVTALAALGLMILAVIISVLTILGAASAPAGPVLPDAVLPENPAPAESNSTALVFFIVFLVVLFLLVSILSLREHRRSEQNKE